MPSPTVNATELERFTATKKLLQDTYFTLNGNDELTASKLKEATKNLLLAVAWISDQTFNKQVELRTTWGTLPDKTNVTLGLTEINLKEQ